MRTNLKNKSTTFTHEGGKSSVLTPARELRRTVMANMLFEDSFYESGVDAAVRICALIKKVSFDEAAQIAIDAREKMKVRHAPLLVVRELLRNHSGRKVGDLIYQVIQRPDEMAELLALYWKENPNAPLSAQLKIGLARAFGKFNEYQLAKWNKEAAVRLRDVLFLSHAKPRLRGKGEKFTKEDRKLLSIGNRISARPFGLGEDEILYGKVAHNQLETPDTWEVQLSTFAGNDAEKRAFKRATFERLIKGRKLGAMALLRNLRGMIEAGVDEDVIRAGLSDMNAERVLPFRFISAAKYAPRLEDALEAAMFRCLAEVPNLGGKTALLIDHSGSMGGLISARSEISRFDAAAALAMILCETTEQCRVFTFAERCIEVPTRRGFAMIAAVKVVVDPVGTKIGKAVRQVYKDFPECNRIIVITDEQSMDRPPTPQGAGYIINVAGYKQGIGYGDWVTIDGWSEAILDYIKIFEEQ